MGATQDLARFITTTTAASLPPILVERLQCYLLDALSSAVNGRELPWTTIVADRALARGGRGEATAIGIRQRLPAASASWVNAITIGAAELDHGAHQTHPASTVLPAALAIAESHHRPGSDLLAAMAVGYEVACRVGAAGTRAVEDERHFHNPGANGPFGAAAAAASLLRIDARQAAHALGIAGSASAGLTEYLADGSMTKRLHLGAAARGGLEAAELAAAGFTGPTTVLEGERGYLATFSTRPEPALLVERLGERWLAADMKLKEFPCHGTLQGVVAALGQVRTSLPRAGGRGRGVRGVMVRLGPGERLAERRFHVIHPKTLIEAQYSLPGCVAVALCRDLSSPAGFSEEVLHDPEVRRVAQAVSWASSATHGITLEVDTVDRGIITLRAEPLAARISLASSVEKFHRYGEGSMPVRSRTRVVDLVLELPAIPEASDVLRTLNRALTAE